jgi:pimeloyl-ACP methyl ester carboxylesterase
MMADQPPPIAGARRSFVDANGVRFHVTEAGPPDGRPVLALHGWPQHHWEYRDLLADPPPGLRIIAPDLPGYGWSGPAPHKWAKDDVATDVLALLDALGLDRVLLVAHDWGAAVGYLMVLREPERFDGYLAMNINHPWQSPRAALPHLWRLAYQLPLATFGVAFQRHTNLVHYFLKAGSKIDPADARVFADRSATRCAPAPAGTPIGRSCFASCPLPHANPKRDGPPCRYGCSTVPATPSSAPRWCQWRPRTPTTTRWNPSTPPTSSSTSARTWCARS